VPSRRIFVSTLLTFVERSRVDAVAAAEYDVAHRDSIREVVADVRVRRAQAVVVSAACCHSPDASRIEGALSSMVYDFPGVATLALVSERSEMALSAVLLLGRTGIRSAIDARTPDGWRTLRDTLAARAATGDIQTAATAELRADLCDAPADCRRLFLTLFSVHEPIARVDQLAQLLAVLPSTLISRFARSVLPSPKVYLSWARLVRAAALLEERGTSVSAVATALDYSSPQAFSRHVELQTGLTVSAFRRTHDGRAMLARFRQELVLRHMATLRTFSPLGRRGPGSGVRYYGDHGDAHPGRPTGGDASHPRATQASPLHVTADARVCGASARPTHTVPPTTDDHPTDTLSVVDLGDPTARTNV
jgi:AraC-like DNA-binding protein